MNLDECANCFLHDWKQPDSKDDLQKCKRCKRIKYCGKDCQTEHWKKLHKGQCKYLADPKLIQESRHIEDACVICIQLVGVEKCKLKNPKNTTYECLYKSQMWEELKGSEIYHDHPFPVTGQRGNTKEKLVIVMWNLVYKFRGCQPKIVQYFDDGLKKMLRHLLMERINIWANRKMVPHLQFDYNKLLDPNFWMAVEETVRRSASDPLQVWKTVQLIDNLSAEDYLSRILRALKDPLKTLPVQFRMLVTKGLDRAPKFLAVANQVLDSLTSQVLHFQDILTIICGGNLKQACNFCKKRVIITGVDRQDGTGCVAFFDCLFIGLFVCNARNCVAKRMAMREERGRFGLAVVAAITERDTTRCDFCFLVSPLGDAHRCSRCCTTMYCSKTCQLKDWKIHKEVCKEESVERKIKFGREERKEEAGKIREHLKTMGDSKESKLYLEEACALLENFELEKAKKKSKK